MQLNSSNYSNNTNISNNTAPTNGNAKGGKALQNNFFVIKSKEGVSERNA